MYFHKCDGIDKIVLLTKDLNPITVNAHLGVMNTRSPLEKEATEFLSENDGPLQFRKSHDILTHSSCGSLWISFSQLTKGLQKEKCSLF